MMNAAAPMIGGVIWPPDEAQASTARCELGPIADTLAHQWDRERAGGDDVGHRRSGNGAHKAGRDCGRLGRPADLVPGQTDRQVDEELAGAPSGSAPHRR